MEEEGAFLRRLPLGPPGAATQATTMHATPRVAVPSTIPTVAVLLVALVAAHLILARLG